MLYLHVNLSKCIYFYSDRFIKTQFISKSKVPYNRLKIFFEIF